MPIPSAMKVLALCILGSLLPATSDAFSVQSVDRNHPTLTMSSAGEPKDWFLSRRSFGGVFGAGAVSSILLGNVEKASAFTPSSMIVADQIKTLDLSLPSYDAISNSKASVNNVEGFAETYNPVGAATKVTSPTKATEPSSGGGNPLGAILPSMNKSNIKKPRPDTSS